jgi:hypothetical protein
MKCRDVHNVAAEMDVSGSLALVDSSQTDISQLGYRLWIHRVSAGIEDPRERESLHPRLGKGCCTLHCIVCKHPDTKQIGYIDLGRLRFNPHR